MEGGVPFKSGDGGGVISCKNQRRPPLFYSDLPVIYCGANFLTGGKNIVHFYS